jgi:2-phospho-L-lactate guanylyltransferase
MAERHLWVVIVPVKPTAVGKSRLDHPDRPALALAMAADTVAAAAAVDDDVLTAVLVVTDDPLARATVEALGPGRPVVVVGDEPDAGLNAALAHGAALAARRWPGRGVAALSADLAALRPGELRAALLAASGPVPPEAGAAGSGRSVLADAAGLGTVLLAAAPGVELAPAFGPDSLAAHVRSGARDLTGILGAAVPGLRRDVDTLADLRAALALGVGSATGRTLADRALADRALADRALDGRRPHGVTGAPRR